MTAQQTHYDVLGLDHETCELDDIKKAFKKLALVHHPDRVPPEMKEEAAEKFRSVRDAFEVLSDGPAKLRYDTELGLRKKKHKKTEPKSQTTEGPQKHAAPRRTTRRRQNNNVAAEHGNYYNKNAVGGDVEDPRMECLKNSAKIGIIIVVVVAFTLLFVLTR